MSESEIKNDTNEMCKEVYKEEYKEMYNCECCNYYTYVLCNFKSHIESKKHTANVAKLNVKVNMEKIKIYCCDNCNKIYKSKKALHYHKNNCNNDKINKINNKLDQQNQQIQHIIQQNNQIQQNDQNQMIKTLTEFIDDYKTIVKDVLTIAKENSKTANKSMSILKYAKLNLKDVTPFHTINCNEMPSVIGYKNPKNTESKNEEYVKIAIHKFNHHIFHSFVGEMIIEYYKPKRKMDANLIATDTSRLSFIMMQKITKGKNEQKEWINDKSGKKFTELVLNPVIDAVKQTLIEFIEFKKTKELNETNLCLMAKCVELRRDIEVKKFTNQILKYVAPHFHFDNLKLLSDMEKINDMDLTNYSDLKDNKSKGCDSMKIITKKKNKN